MRAAIPASLGTAAGDILLMSVSAFGLSVIAHASGFLFPAVKIAGVLYLAWIGVGIPILWGVWITLQKVMVLFR